MGKWYCFKCKEEMVDDTVWMFYLRRKSPIGGIRCPKCREPYLLEDTVVRRVNRAEEMMEKKG